MIFNFKCQFPKINWKRHSSQKSWMLTDLSWDPSGPIILWECNIFGIQRPTAKQQLPRQWEFQIVKFGSIIIDLLNELTNNQIGNFDEMFVQCDLHLGYIGNTESATEVQIKILGYEINVLLSIYLFVTMVIIFLFCYS